MPKQTVTVKVFPIGFMSTLFFIFLVLKLCHVIDWSWWFVTLPLWWWIGVLAAILGVVVAVGAVCGAFWLLCYCIGWMIETSSDYLCARRRKNIHNRLKDTIRRNS